MVRTALLCGFTDGRSSIWPALSSLRTRVGIVGGYHIIFSRSRSTTRRIPSERLLLRMSVQISSIQNQELAWAHCEIAPESNNGILQFRYASCSDSLDWWRGASAALCEIRRMAKLQANTSMVPRMPPS